MVVVAALALAPFACAQVSESTGPCNELMKQGRTADAVRCVNAAAARSAGGAQAMFNGGIAALKQIWQRKNGNTNYPSELANAQFVGFNQQVGQESVYQKTARLMYEKKIFQLRMPPNHPAVMHAVQNDMPARGGTPEAVTDYINTPQNKQWYSAKFHIR